MYEVLIELIEYKVVLDKSNEIIHGYRLDDWNLNQNRSLNNSIRMSSPNFEEEIKEGRPSSRQSEGSFREVSIRYIAGTIDAIEAQKFKRLLFRACRGKVLQYYQPMDEPLKDFSGKALDKVVFLLAFEEGTHLKDKIGKICDSFMATRF